jgi:hypothetical protein
LLCVPGCPEMATLLPQFLECWNLKACATMPSYSFFIFLSFFFFHDTRVWTKAMHFARQAVCHLSYATSPFCFGYFSKRFLLLCPAWPGWQFSCWHFWCSWSGRHISLQSAGLEPQSSQSPPPQ